MEQLKMQTKDIAESNVAKIAALFPNCVTEHKNSKGETVLGIDFEKLQQELSSDLIKEEACAHLPTHHVGPLIAEQREVAP